MRTSKMQSYGTITRVSYIISSSDSSIILGQSTILFVMPSLRPNRFLVSVRPPELLRAAHQR